MKAARAVLAITPEPEPLRHDARRARRSIGGSLLDAQPVTRCRRVAEGTALMPGMGSITRAELHALEARSRVFARKAGRSKVFEDPDGLIWKAVDTRLHGNFPGFHRQAWRFVRNARRLSRWGIPCPEVVRVLRVDQPDEHVIVYRPLPGDTVRDVLQGGGSREALRRDLAVFIARLHALGLYFRGGHVGNYVLRPDGQLGVIDLQSMWHSAIVPNPVVRAHSFRILFKYPQDRELLGDGGRLGPFVECYFTASGTSRLGRRIFMETIRRRFPEIARAI
jgi:hypothetical protein